MQWISPLVSGGASHGRCASKLRNTIRDAPRSSHKYKLLPLSDGKVLAIRPPVESS